MRIDKRSILKYAERYNLEAKNTSDELVEKVMPSDVLEEQLVGVLENEPLHLDEIARIASMPASIVSARLTIMELKGMVKNLGGGIYKRI